jgi:hypothetical protein
MSKRLSMLSSRVWWRYLLDTIAFIAVLVGLEYAIRQPSAQQSLGIRLSWGMSNESLAVLQHFSQQDPPPDMIVIGSSVAQTSIMPRRLSEQLYQQTGLSFSIINMGGNYLSADLTYDFVTQLMAEVYTPRILLYPLFPLDLITDDDSRRQTYLLNSSLAEIWFDDAFYTPWLQPWILGSQWMQYSLNMATWLIGDFQRADLNNYRGFHYVEREDIGVHSIAASYQMPALPAHSLAMQRLEQLLVWGQENSVFVILFPSPLPDAFVQSPQGQQILSYFHAFLQALDREYPNVLYINLLAEGGLSLSNGFYDPTHVNVRGAEAWTDRLAQALLGQQANWPNFAAIP